MQRNVVKKRFYYASEVDGMDLLEYGMKNEKSASPLRRKLARGILELEKKKADRYEEMISRKQISFPDGPWQDEMLLRRIRERIAECEADGKIPGSRMEDAGNDSAERQFRHGCSGSEGG